MPSRFRGGGLIKGKNWYILLHSTTGIHLQEKYPTFVFDDGLKDYKLMCFDGKVLCSFVCSERFSEEGLKVTFYDRNWNVLPFERHYPKSSKGIDKPKTYDKMVAYAERLSEGIPFLRVDFYEINKKIYFGELTFYPGSGLEEFNPNSADYELGSWIRLPINKNF